MMKPHEDQKRQPQGNTYKILTRAPGFLAPEFRRSGFFGHNIPELRVFWKNVKNTRLNRIVLIRSGSKKIRPEVIRIFKNLTL